MLIRKKIVSSSVAAVAEVQNAPISWLALGAFAIGTEGFMIAGILPEIAKELSISLSMAGQLVTAFALAYAISSPILTTMTASFNRRRLLLLALTCFSIANFLAWAATSFWLLMAARIMLALAAGLYMPNANALASSIVPPEYKGRALATVHSGITIAIALGAPIGAFVGNNFGWRSSFAVVGCLATLITLGLLFGLRHDSSTHLTTPSLAERLAVARQPKVLLMLLVTTLWATGIWTIYPYLSPFLTHSTGISDTRVGVVLFLYGICALIGVSIGGICIDKLGSRKVMIGGVLVLSFTYMSLAVFSKYLSPSVALFPIVAAIMIWGIAGFTFNPAQQANLIEIVGQKLAPVSLSLNGSFLYIGFSLGAVLGSFTLSLSGITNIGAVAASCELAALVLMLIWLRRFGRYGYSG